MRTKFCALATPAILRERGTHVACQLARERERVFVISEGPVTGRSKLHRPSSKVQE